MSRPFNGTNQSQANQPVIGRYVKTYWCKDHTGGPENHITRTFDVVDRAAPTIHLLQATYDTSTGMINTGSISKLSAGTGSVETIVQAARDSIVLNKRGIFHDPGATCVDETDGNLNHAVVVS